MPAASRVPPGRAGRLWLQRRQAVAERGRDQLDRKLRVLLPQRQSLAMQAQRLRAQWETAWAEAATWALRAALLGAEDGIVAALPPGTASAVVRWETVMGVALPVDVDVALPERSPLPPSTAATGPAVDAARGALVLGVRTAAAEDALRRLEDEIAVTRRRLRAIETRWLPWLQLERARLELALEQAEQDDGLRLRRAAGAAAEGVEGGGP